MPGLEYAPHDCGSRNCGDWDSRLGFLGGSRPASSPNSIAPAIVGSGRTANSLARRLPLYGIRLGVGSVHSADTPRLMPAGLPAAGWPAIWRPGGPLQSADPRHFLARETKRTAEPRSVEAACNRPSGSTVRLLEVLPARPQQHAHKGLYLP